MVSSKILARGSHNPSGNFYSPEKFLVLIESAESNEVLVTLDEERDPRYVAFLQKMKLPVD